MRGCWTGNAAERNSAITLSLSLWRQKDGSLALVLPFLFLVIPPDRRFVPHRRDPIAPRPEVFPTRSSGVCRISSAPLRSRIPYAEPTLGTYCPDAGAANCTGTEPAGPIRPSARAADGKRRCVFSMRPRSNSPASGREVPTRCPKASTSARHTNGGWPYTPPQVGSTGRSGPW